MEDIVHFNRLADKCMNIISNLGNLHEAAKTLTKNPSQDNIDMIAQIIQSYENNSEEMKNCLVSFLKEVVKSDDTVDASETELGYKL
jgi:hypothetical protein